MKTKHLLKFFIAIAVSCTPLTTHAQVSVGLSINIPPPAIPVYDQPLCPGDGYLWTPGYWAYGPDGYYWVPGVWVSPPDVGVLWTPGYWDFGYGYYHWHRGYWGQHVGYYGGVNYGFGYIGIGFAGGMWEGSHFRYNTAVMNVNTTIVHNTYYNHVTINNTSRASFNGPGGVTARPRPEELAAMNEHHFQPTTQQQSHQQWAGHSPGQFAKANNGRPATTAVPQVRAGGFQHSSVTSPANSGFGSQRAVSQPAAHTQAQQPQSQRQFAPRPQQSQAQQQQRQQQQAQQQAQQQQQRQQQQQAQQQQQRQQQRQFAPRPQQQQPRPQGGGGFSHGNGGGGVNHGERH